MSRRARWLVGAAVLVAAGALFLPAGADWLVTRQGDRIETDGPWRVESRLVVFKLADGTYSSLRRSDVDLDASERLTREMAARSRTRAAEESAAPRESVARLTERDLPPVPAGERRRSGEDGEEDEEADGEAGETPPGELEIVSWREIGGPTATGTDVVGTVRNNSDKLAVGVGVTVTLYDVQGEEAGRSRAILTANALPAGQSSGFRASFPGVYQYARIELETSGNLVNVQPREPGAPPPR